MTSLALLPLRHDSARGIACLVAGIAVFSMQDLILKLLSGGYPLHEAMVLRSLTALPFLLILVHRDGGLGGLLSPRWPWLCLRGAIMFSAYTCYYLALAALPMATTAALYFAAPLFITVLSIVILGETVRPLRWLAVCLGFVGVIVMVRPGSALFDWAALLAVISGMTYGLSMVAARKLGAEHSASVMAFYVNGVFLLAACGLALVFGSGHFTDEAHKSLGFLMRGWSVPTRFDLFLMMACGPIAAVGLTLLTQAYRIAEANTIAPFEYTALVWSVIYGWTFWRDWPDTTGWIGIAIIVAAGLMVLYSEGTRSRAELHP